MRVRSVTQTLLVWLALIASGTISEAARQTTFVKRQGTVFRIDWWDDGRLEPYELHFTTYGVSSVYAFDALGSLTALKTGGTLYTFDMDVEAANGAPEIQSSATSSDVGSRMLLGTHHEAVDGAVGYARRRLYACTDCEETWDTVCDVGLVDVCDLVELWPSVFTKDAQTSLVIVCSAFGAACKTSAFDACDGQCTEGALVISVKHPSTQKMHVRGSEL